MKLAGIHSIKTANQFSWFNEAQGPGEWWAKMLAKPSNDLTDRPDSLSRLVRREGDWRWLDYRDCYLDALQRGLFGVVWLDCLGNSHLDGRLQAAVRGVAAAGMQVALKLDSPVMNNSVVAANPSWSEQQIVAEIVRQYTLLYQVAPDAQLRDDNGRVVIGPYHAETWSPGRWNAVLDGIEAGCGVKTAFMPDFANTSPLAAFAAGMPRLTGGGIWGDRNPAMVAARGVSTIKAFTDRGLQVVQYTAGQDSRPYFPSQGKAVYDESCNSETLRATFDLAMSSPAITLTQFTTMDDRFENAACEDGVFSGDGWMTLISYFNRRFLLGVAPVITKDVVFLSHRLVSYAALPTSQDVTVAPLMALRSGSTPSRDTIEVLAFLTSSAELFLDGVSLGTWGPGVVPVPVRPLSTGAHTAEIRRGSTTVAVARSTQPVVASQPRQNLVYHLVGSVHDASWHAAPAVSFPPSSTPWAVPIVPDPTPRIMAAQTQAGIASDGLFGNDSLTAWEESQAEAATLAASNAQLTDDNEKLHSASVAALGYITQAEQALTE